LLAYGIVRYVVFEICVRGLCSRFVFEVCVWGFTNRSRLLQYDHVYGVERSRSGGETITFQEVAVAWVFFLVGRREIGVEGIIGHL